MHPEASTERVQAEVLGPNFPDWNIGDADMQGDANIQVGGKQELLMRAVG